MKRIPVESNIRDCELKFAVSFFFPRLLFHIDMDRETAAIIQANALAAVEKLMSILFEIESRVSAEDFCS